MVKRIWVLLLILSITITGCAVNPTRQGSIDDLAQPTLVPTAASAANPMYRVERGEVIYDVVFSGRIAPVVEETLSFPIDGVIAAVYVIRGDLVEAGDLIAELDTQDIEEALAQAQTTLDIALVWLKSRQDQITRDILRAEIQVQIAQINLDRAIANAGDNPTEDEKFGISLQRLQLELKQLDLDELSGALDPTLQADVDAAVLQVTRYEEMLLNASLTAPFAGQITSLMAVPGFALDAFDTIGILADLDQVEISVNLPDTEMKELAVGMPAHITASNVPGEAFAATLTRLPYPFGSGGGLEISEADAALRFTFDNLAEAKLFELGERIQIKVVIERKEGVLILPTAAIRDFNGRKFVVVQTEGLQQRVDVTLGISGNGLVEIVAGLHESQIVVGQ